MKVPDDLSYTAEHEWIAEIDPTRARIGITDYAQDQLGDIVFVDLPKVGDVIESGAVIGEVESTKSVGEVYAPFAGTIVAANEALAQGPEVINSDPYGEGWLVEIEHDGLPSDLLDSAAYIALTE